ncbi:hypothetical protein HMPREF1355_00491, partial [Enterococcus faecium 515]
NSSVLIDKEPKKARAATRALSSYMSFYKKNHITEMRKKKWKKRF